MRIVKFEDVNVKAVSRNMFVVDGREYSSETVARYAECTHKQCTKCDEYVTKGSLICAECSDKLSAEKWLKSKKKPASEGDVFYSKSRDEFYYGVEEIPICESYESLRLYHCVREKSPNAVDLYDVYEGVMPENLDVDDMVTPEIVSVCKKLNDLIAEHPVNCFFPTEVGVL